mgnify:FL=1|jgi:hypothetical protein
MKRTDYELTLPDQLFPTDNDLEIPILDIDMQAKECQSPFLCFGKQKRTFNLNGEGSLHFYTDDYRFSAIYEHPEKILQHHPAVIVEPNFSLYNEMPVSFGLQAIYKKRWIARCMQGKGIGIFVDLNVAQKFYRLNMIGVPRGWRAFATRGYSDRLNNLAFEYSIASDWAEGKEPLFVIYGGGAECRRFAQTHRGCIYINPVVTTKKQLAALQKIHEGVAFIGEEFSVKAQLDKLTPFSKQIEDFRTDNVSKQIEEK